MVSRSLLNGVSLALSTGLQPVLNHWTRQRSANVQQHRVDGNEIFVILVRISSFSDVRNEILQRIFEIRMQIAKNVNEWLIIHRGAVLDRTIVVSSLVFNIQYLLIVDGTQSWLSPTVARGESSTETTNRLR
jgi:hypothetical protein